MIEILTTGLLNSVQDLGRPGRLSQGVSIGGAMDRPAIEAANILLRNEVTAAGLEVAFFPFRLRAEADIAVAVTGADCAATLDGLTCPPWWAFPMHAGQTLALGAPRSGVRAYIAFAGGVDVPEVLGSRATDLRGGFGGFNGRGLSRGDKLALRPSRPAGGSLAAGLGAVPPDRVLPLDSQRTELRVLPAAEYDAFTTEALAAFAGSEWTVTADANRMGCRLSGPELTLRKPLELLSHGIVPGVVQVPPSGQPIVQLADANTCGGYPKVATVIGADLWRLAQAQVGSTVRFVRVEEEVAIQELALQKRWLDELAGLCRLLDIGDR